MWIWIWTLDESGNEITIDNGNDNQYRVLERNWFKIVIHFQEN